jgi:carbon storage regulator
MLVLTRRSNQSIMIGDNIEVSVLSVMGDKVRIGIDAPANVPVFRTEIYLEIQSQEADKEMAAGDHGGGAGGAKPAEVDDALRKLGES